ncbi:MAG: hypothetical protein QM786_07895 [Breznakibacter sp.]
MGKCLRVFKKRSFVEIHYGKLGLLFPAQSINGAVWGIWSLCFSVAIVVAAKKYTLLQTTLIAWLIGFVMVWLALWDLNVLPLTILPIAVPLSFLETFMASFIVRKLLKHEGPAGEAT